MELNSLNQIGFRTADMPLLGPRYSNRDNWIQESIKRIIFNSGLFWAVGAAEKNNQNC